MNNKIKTKFLLFGYIIALILLSACSSYLEDSTINQDGEENVVNHDIVDSQVNAATSKPTVTVTPQPTKSAVQLEAEAYLADKESIPYESWNGDQSCFWATNYTASEDGYYYITGPNGSVHYIWHYDIATGTAEKFCARPDCYHGRSCNACISETQYDFTSIFYANNRVYLIKHEADGSYLISYAKDATDYQKHGKLWEKDVLRNDFFGFRWARMATVVGDTLFYFTSEDYDTYRLCSIPLDGSDEAETLTEFVVEELMGQQMDLCCPHIQWMNGIYFSVIGFAEETDFASKVIKYSIETGSMEVLLETETFMRHFIVVGEQLYYYMDGIGFCVRTIGLENERVLYPDAQNGSQMLSWDGVRFYLDNGLLIDYYNMRCKSEGKTPEPMDHVITVLDTTGTVIDTITIEFQFCSLTERLIFGDSRNLFIISGIGEQGRDLVYLSKELSKKKASKYVLMMDKRLLGSGIQFWTAISPENGEYLIEWTTQEGIVYYFDEEEGMIKEMQQ